jgi:hypothetical protein
VHNPAAYSSVRKIQEIVYKIPFYKWLASNSHLVNLARIIATRSDDRARGNRFRERDKNGNAPAAEKSLSINSSVLTEEIVSAFYRRVANDSGHFIFMNLPSKKQALSNNYLGNEDVPDYVVQTDNILQMLGRHDYNSLDLVPVFSRLEVDKLYFRNDGHMNSAGHRVVAAQLKQYLTPYILDLVTPR